MSETHSSGLQYISTKLVLFLLFIIIIFIIICLLGLSHSITLNFIKKDYSSPSYLNFSAICFVVFEFVRVTIKVCFYIFYCSLFLGCISSKCCPGQQEMYPGDHVTLTLEKGRNDSGVWCGHEFVVRLKDEPCDGCAFVVSFADFSMPFTPTVELLETNYSQSAFYGPSFQWLKTLVNITLL